MSSVYDGPCPAPSDREADELSLMADEFMRRVHTHFGHERAEVLLDDWHVSAVVDAIGGRFERSTARRILADLNEKYRLEQFIDLHRVERHRGRLPAPGARAGARALSVF